MKYEAERDKERGRERNERADVFSFFGFGKPIYPKPWVKPNWGGAPKHEPELGFMLTRALHQMALVFYIQIPIQRHQLNVLSQIPIQ